jgi:hypothetical protein
MPGVMMMAYLNPINRDNLLRRLGALRGYPRFVGSIYEDVLYESVNCPDYDGKTVIQTNVYVKPPRNDGRRKHRIYVGCPECGKHVPFGRIAQHYKVH